MVTKNGLFKVEMESPILAPPPPPSPPPRWQPTAAIKAATTSITTRMVVILLLMFLLSLSASQSVGHHGEGDHGAYDHLLQNAETLSRFRPFLRTPRMSAPIRVPEALPTPPERLAPPITTAAMASSS